MPCACHPRGRASPGWLRRVVRRPWTSRDSGRVPAPVRFLRACSVRVRPIDQFRRRHEQSKHSTQSRRIHGQQATRAEDELPISVQSTVESSESSAPTHLDQGHAYYLSRCRITELQMRTLRCIAWPHNYLRDQVNHNGMCERTRRSRDGDRVVVEVAMAKRGMHSKVRC